MRWLDQLVSGSVLDRACEWFDVHGQRFLLKAVYAHEFWALLVVAILLLLWRRRCWWGPLRWVLLFLVLCYLLLFRMHWYSWIAWPLMAGAGGFAWSRDRWYRVVGFRWTVPRSWKTALTNLGSPRRVVRVIGGALVVLVVGSLVVLVVVHFFDLRLDLLWFLMSLAVWAVVLAWLMTKLGGGSRELERYLNAQPRASDYLDAIRLLRCKHRETSRSLLAGSRLADNNLPNGYTVKWTWIFRMCCVPGFRAVLRFLAEHEWMPTVRSNFVTQQIQFGRQKVWNEYDAARYGGLPRTKSDVALGAYLERAASYRAEHARAGLPPELEPDPRKSRLRRIRIRWLALTEALAECYAFSDPAAAPKKAKQGSDLSRSLLAAELLSHAGELQHEIVRDFRGCNRQRGGSPASGEAEKQQLQRETQLAIHFFDLAARCIESVLDPERALEAQRWTLAKRRAHFCRPLPVGTPSAEARGTDDDQVRNWLRRCLGFRYHVIDLLKSSTKEEKGVGVQDEATALQEWFRPVAAPTTRDPSLEESLAQLAEQAACASLWLELRRGDLARMTWPVSARTEIGDRLAALERLSGLAESLAFSQHEAEYRVTEATRRVAHLWGLAVEQELDHLHAGSEVWHEQCQLASNLYQYAKSLRIRRVCALAGVVGVSQPRRESPARAPQPEPILELG